MTSAMIATAMTATAMGGAAAGAEAVPRAPGAATGGAPLPAQLQCMVRAADPTWQPVIERGLQAVAHADPGYLTQLLGVDFLPEGGRLFAAFAQPMDRVRYILIGEGPFPRAASATGVCFMDGAVGTLWSKSGLSKPVNRATSLRNFIKMLLVADGQLLAAQTAGMALAEIASVAQAPGSWLIPTLADLQRSLHANGFLLLNATLVFRADVPPAREARAWRPFLQIVLDALASHALDCGRPPPTLVLWGKVAAQVEALSIASAFPKVRAEHPYNLSFIVNSTMHRLFGPMRLLHVRKPST